MILIEKTASGRPKRSATKKVKDESEEEDEEEDEDDDGEEKGNSILPILTNLIISDS